MTDISPNALYDRSDLVALLSEHAMRELTRQGGLRAFAGLYRGQHVLDAWDRVVAQRQEKEGVPGHGTDQPLAQSTRRAAIRDLPAPRRAQPLVDQVERYERAVSEAEVDHGT